MAAAAASAAAAGCQQNPSGMTHMKKNQGLFSIPVYITSGDPYEKKDAGNSRLRGMQFKTNPQKRGQTADNWGLKKRDFKPLYEGNPKGEPYHAAGESAMKHANLERKKCLKENGFRYSNPTKMQCSTGAAPPRLAAAAAAAAATVPPCSAAARLLQPIAHSCCCPTQAITSAASASGSTWNPSTR